MPRRNLALLGLALVAGLALCVGGAPAPSERRPWESVWLRIKADPELEMLVDWVEFAAASGDTLAEALAKRRLAGIAAAELGEPELQGARHLYKLQEIDLDTKVGQLELGPRERLYLTADDLLAY